jgi:hypothetical protein
MTNAKVTVHGVLAGAYRGNRAKLDALLTHASVDGGSTALCGNVAEGNLCDAIEPEPPSCKRCFRRAVRDHEKAAGALCIWGSDGCCTLCGVMRSECNECHGIGYHMAGCPESDEERV